MAKYLTTKGNQKWVLGKGGSVYRESKVGVGYVCSRNFKKERKGREGLRKENQYC